MSQQLQLTEENQCRLKPGQKLETGMSLKILICE